MDYLKYCEENKKNCVVLLKTPRAGDTVDNGMGVEFDLKPYTLICRDDDVIPHDMKYGSLDAPSQMQVFETHGCPCLEDFIQELHDMDEYEVIWRNTEYKDPEKIKSELIREGYEIKIDAKLFYKIKVPYDGLKKYFQRDKPSPYQTDMFSTILQDMDNFDSLVGKYFPLDRAHFQEMLFKEEGIEFLFTMNKKEEITMKEGDPFEDTQKKIEQEDNPLRSIKNYIETQLKSK